MISLISSLSLKLYPNSLVYHRNIFGSSSKVFGNLQKSSDIFGNFRKMFGSACLTFGTILENLRKSSEGGRKSSENHKKRRHQNVYITNKKNITRRLEHMNFIFSWQKQYFTHSLHSFLKCCFAPPCNILYIYLLSTIAFLSIVISHMLQVFKTLLDK